MPDPATPKAAKPTSKNVAKATAPARAASSPASPPPSPSTSQSSAPSAAQIVGSQPVIDTRHMPADGRVRAVVDAVLPAVDNGRFAAKTVAGESIRITAYVFTDGHDVPRAMLRWRAENEPAESAIEVPMKALVNDVWEASFVPPSIGRYVYTVVAWVDPFESWHREMTRRVDGDDVRIASQVGAIDIAAAAARAAAIGSPEAAEDSATLSQWAKSLQAAALDPAHDAARLKLMALDADMAQVAARYPDRRFEARYPIELPLIADRKRAAFSSWYELFPRSASPEPGRHGTFKDVETRLPAIAAMGFDVLYFPPIHPIGRIQRKGRNNKLVTEEGDVGSPWAIGADEGGHKAILPELGTAEDFRHLVAETAKHGMEIAMDIAFQCAPDHPYVKEHPSWFRWRPDNTVQYAENPPKKYQDIYPFNFESDDWQGLWAELKSVFDHWIGEGVKIFRVDNPHTKAFPFWEWCITEVKREHPEVLFLAEAFTRPKVMHRLAKLGYSQSYTYFTWRNDKYLLTQYFTELSSGLGSDYFRPNAWPNTPDILHEQLHEGDSATYMARLVLAATLASNYGIYGPAYELREHLPREPGSEEYLDSEKYQLRHWNHEDARSIAPFITRINQIRKEHAALQNNSSLRFLNVGNDQLIAYAKASDDGEDVIVTVVNLDRHNVQSGWIDLDPSTIGVPADQPFQVHDLLSDQRFVWRGYHHYIQLDPHNAPAHVFQVRRLVRSERDFDYFL